MKRVTGVGGVFIRAKDPEAMTEWYRKHLGIDIMPWGGTAFKWNNPDRPEPDGGVTVWSLFPNDTDYFGSATQQVMVNYRVENLEALIAVLRAEGCNVDAKTEVSEFGSFGWVTDPEGNRIELWQPPAMAQG